MKGMIMQGVCPVGVNPSKTQDCQYAQQYVQSKPSSEPILLTHEKQEKQMSTGEKAGIAAAITSAIIAIGAIIVTRGKAAKKAKMLAKIPPDLQTRFAKIKNLQGKEFVDKAYGELVEHMGLKGIAPKQIIQQGKDGLSITGGYNLIDNTIQYTEGFFTKLSKPEQISLLSHELQHCKQITTMLRTEGITVEKYLEAMAEASVKNARNNPFNFLFNDAYDKTKAAGKLDEFISKNIKEMVQNDLARVKQNFSEVLKLPKIKADSVEGRKAYEYLDAAKDYTGLNFLGIGSDAYRNHLFEVEAYGFGDKIKDLFSKFIEATT